MTGLVRCHGLGGMGCPDDALVREGRTCSECERRQRKGADSGDARPSRKGRVEIPTPDHVIEERSRHARRHL